MLRNMVHVYEYVCGYLQIRKIGNMHNLGLGCFNLF